MRRRRCRCTTSSSHVVRLSLSVSLSISSRLCCLSSDTDLLLFPYVPYPLALLAHGAYVNRTMTYDHTTSSRGSTIYPLLASTTDIILFYSSFTFSSSIIDALPILSHVQMPVYRQEGWECVRRRAGPVVRIHLEKLSNKSTFESSNEKINNNNNNLAELSKVSFVWGYWSRPLRHYILSYPQVSKTLI